MDPTAQILDQITQTTERIVSSPGFMNQLGDAIARKLLERDPYPFAVDLKSAAEHHLLAAPRKLSDGRLLVLTQTPIRQADNISLLVIAKDASLLDKPRPEGRELENFKIVLYHDRRPGELTARKVFQLDPESHEELQRQLKELSLVEVQFFYLNTIISPRRTEQEQ